MVGTHIEKNSFILGCPRQKLLTFAEQCSKLIIIRSIGGGYIALGGSQVFPFLSTQAVLINDNNKSSAVVGPQQE
jgi:hypothetical protein